MAKGKNSAIGSVRIIGGDWRSRKVEVVEAPGLRPTIDRVRETLFNWLMFDIAGRNCLDLFAGSGVLGMESLSRGAAHCTFIENNSKVAAAIRSNLTKLNADQQSFNLLEQNAISYLSQWQDHHHRFDVVFIDPPFSQNLLPEVILELAKTNCLNDGAKIFIELARNDDLPSMPETWQCVKQKKAGQSKLFLFKVFV